MPPTTSRTIEKATCTTTSERRSQWPRTLQRGVAGLLQERDDIGLAGLEGGGKPEEKNRGE